MKLESVYLKQFRVYRDLSIKLHPNLTIITGDNAQGKTSILEAIHVLSRTKSHRGVSEDSLIQNGAEFAKIEAVASLNNRHTHFSMTLSKHGKTVKYNKLEIPKLSDYIGRLNIVMFSPEDLNLIKGGPLDRRRFLDFEIGQLNKHYVIYLTHFRRLLKERNEVLKKLSRSEKYDALTLDVMNEQMAHYAQKIVLTRRTFIKEINERIKNKMPTITEDDPTIDILYAPSIEKDFFETLRKKQALDLHAKTTTAGPHRDDFMFKTKQQDIRHTASQGQMRTIVLALKLVLIDMIKANKNISPVVLLDDVFSELDDKRQTQLLNQLGEDSQVLITATTIDERQIKQTAYQRINIRAGKIEGV